MNYENISPDVSGKVIASVRAAECLESSKRADGFLCYLSVLERSEDCMQSRLKQAMKERKLAIDARDAAARDLEEMQSCARHFLTELKHKFNMGLGDIDNKDVNDAYLALFNCVVKIEASGHDKFS